MIRNPNLSLLAATFLFLAAPFLQAGPKIMPLAETIPGGYRTELSILFTDAGHSFNFVGHGTGNPAQGVDPPTDGIHPATAGYKQLGAYWFRTITAGDTLHAPLPKDFPLCRQD